MASLGLYALVVVVGIAAVVALSAVLGERHEAPGLPYESGMLPTVHGEGELPYLPRFYVLAMLFVIFDLEAAFLFAWAVAAREAGWLGFVEMLIFVGVLLVALGWLWRVGALDARGRR